jgi:hypothetical protein
LLAKPSPSRAVDLYVEMLTPDEVEQLLSREIYSTVVEVAVG